MLSRSESEPPLPISRIRRDQRQRGTLRTFAVSMILKADYFGQHTVPRTKSVREVHRTIDRE